jgi:gliding motility-associated-like protein
MRKRFILLLFCCLQLSASYCQTTDLAISVEAQDLSGNDISQAHIYEEFQYLVTITNSGDAVSNAIFSEIFNANANIFSYVSQNPVGGTSLITDFNLMNNELTGTITNFPASSSIEIKIGIRAPRTVGGIATTANIFVPNGVTDTNPSNNISIISIDITDTPIDFTVVQQQISPPEGTPISAWGDTVTYHFTITNNSAITYPLQNFKSFLALSSPLNYGGAPVVFVSAECISATNGTTCIDNIIIPTEAVLISTRGEQLMLEFYESHELTSQGSITLELIYQFLEPSCAIEIGTIEMLSTGEIIVDHDNESSNDSNEVNTILLSSTLCLDTDVCIETIQTDPAAGTAFSWNDPVTFETTICNNGPLDAEVIASLRNTSDVVSWQILSVECIPSASTIPCSTTNFANAGSYWVSDFFNMPVGEILTIRTIVIFLEPDCIINPGSAISTIKSNISIESGEIADSFLNNNSDDELINLPDAEPCDTVDLEITKTQISPMLPEGSSEDNTTAWGSITYEITAANLSPDDTIFELSDFMDVTDDSIVTAILESVTCISTTGTAVCNTIEHASIGVELDGVSDDNDNTPDVFWEILLEDNWLLPGNSSITFEVVINWFPICSAQPIPAINNATIEPDAAFIDDVSGNNRSLVATYFAPCVDLVVQTFPEVPSVIVNQPFNWIVDITNSNTSSNAVDVTFEDVLDSVFIVNGLPSCQVSSGTATCISNFSINGNIISGTIPNMEAGSTVRILIPVIAPAFGGAFVNMAEGIPSPVNNEELTPETNISISSVRVLAPTLEKAFNPEQIYTNETSRLTFTVFNPNINTEEDNIAFTDNLPVNLVLASEAQWVSSNGSTANFIGNIGDTFVGVTNLNIPIGVASCTFSVTVTSTVPGFYINNDINFTDQNNIDTSQVYAELEVIQNPNSEIDCLKIPEVFTPNNDGTNDNFVITCLEDYESNSLKIYNRYGVLIFQQNNYTNTWDGKPNSGLLHDIDKPVPVGTYYYILKIENEKPIIGWVYLNY